MSERNDINYEEVFRSMPAIAMLVDREFRFVSVTRMWEEHTNRKLGEVVGRDVLEVLPNNPSDPDSTSNEMFRTFLERTVAEKAFLTKPARRYDIEIPGRGWVEKYYLPAFSPVLDDDGEVAYVMHVVTDITELVASSES